METTTDEEAMIDPMRLNRTEKPMRDALHELLADRQVTLRQLAREVGVDHAHLSRIARSGGKAPTADLAERVALALDLPADYFPEARLGRLIARFAEDGPLRDRTYDRLFKQPRE